MILAISRREVQIWLSYLALKARDTSSGTKSALSVRYTKLGKAQHSLILRPERNFCHDRLKIIFSSIISVNAKFPMWQSHSLQIRPQARCQDNWVRVGHFLMVCAGPGLHGLVAALLFPSAWAGHLLVLRSITHFPLQNHLGHLLPTARFPPCLSLDWKVQDGGHVIFSMAPNDNTAITQ